MFCRSLPVRVCQPLNFVPECLKPSYAPGLPGVSAVLSSWPTAPTVLRLCAVWRVTTRSISSCSAARSRSRRTASGAFTQSPWRGRRGCSPAAARSNSRPLGLAQALPKEGRQEIRGDFRSDSWPEQGSHPMPGRPNPPRRAVPGPRQALDRPVGRGPITGRFPLAASLTDDLYRDRRRLFFLTRPQPCESRRGGPPLSPALCAPVDRQTHRVRRRPESWRPPPACRSGTPAGSCGFLHVVLRDSARSSRKLEIRPRVGQQFCIGASVCFAAHERVRVVRPLAAAPHSPETPPIPAVPRTGSPRPDRPHRDRNSIPP